MQYWQIKEKNYDKVIFFKLGKFYEIFYRDAILCNKELDLAWMSKDKKLHVGFPEKMLDKYIQVLVDMGHKVAVVEQTETTKEAAKRMDDSFTGRKAKVADKVVKREIFGIFTKGTHVGGVQGYEPSFVMAIQKEGSIIAVCYFDISTSSCALGQFEDDLSFSALRTLLSQVRPVEVIIEKDSVPNEMLKMLRNQPNLPIMNIVSADKALSVPKVQTAIDEHIING